MTHRPVWVALFGALACGGTVSGGDAGAEGGTDDSGCPKPPSAPVYGCEAGAPDAQGCGPWSSPASSPVYPIGCVVTTTMTSTYCGPVTCNCTTSPVGDGGATWICPL